MTAPAKTPRPATGLPPARAGRGTAPQDDPEALRRKIADLERRLQRAEMAPVMNVMQVLERTYDKCLKLSADLLAAASKVQESNQELFARTGAYRRLTVLAEEWEAEAGDDLRGESGLAREVALQMCARQLRGALAYGGAE